MGGARPTAGTEPPGADRPRPGQGAASSTAAELEALVVSHWFDSGESGEPYSATIRLNGRRVGLHGQPRASDAFAQEDNVEGIVPGSGPVSVTSWVYGLQPGEWTVTADLIRPAGHAAAAEPADRSRRPGPERLARADWSWRRRSLSDGDASDVTTRWAMLAPLARIPAVIPGSFTLMGTLAIVAALIVQSLLLARQNISVGSSLLVSLLAIVFGLIGAKLWYAILHPGPWRTSLGGWSVDGFLIAAPVVSVVALLIFNLPIGAFLDAAAPGIFVAVAIGRFGCFFTGCCAGRCTTSRWGVWSSDRRIGARRIPAQLLESAAGTIISLTSAILVLTGVFGANGVVFVLAVVAYFVARQFLLRVRAERREYSWRRSRAVAERS